MQCTCKENAISDTFIRLTGPDTFKAAFCGHYIFPNKSKSIC